MTRHLLSLAALLVASLPSGAQTVTVFQSHFAAGSHAYYRIPAIAAQRDTLWVFADDRSGVTDATSWGDIGSRGAISIVARRSTDGGKTWSRSQYVAKGKGTWAETAEVWERAHGDAAVVADRETGELLALAASGTTRYGLSTADDHIRMAAYRYAPATSRWTGSEVTDQMYALTPAKGIFAASGRICQSAQIKAGTHYRIYTVLTCLGMSNQVVCSDDFGQTWKALGGAAAPADDDEAKVEELPDGNLVYSARRQGGRYFNVFTYTDRTRGEGSWGEAVFSGEGEGETTARRNATNGEILLVRATAAKAAPGIRRGKPVYVALQSVPYGTLDDDGENTTMRRSHVSIYWKLFATAESMRQPADWQKGWMRYEVTPESSAYSTMVEMGDGRIGFVYEARGVRFTNGSSQMERYDIDFRPLTLGEITGGAVK